MRWLPALGAAAAVAVGCGYPDFQFGPVGSGGGSGGGTTSSLSTGGAGGTGGQVSTASSSSSSSSGAACDIGHLLISEIRSRGPGGADDEFVEIYNPTPDPVKLDSSWNIKVRSTGAATYDTRWKGDGSTIPPHGHYLIGGSGYLQQPVADGLLSVGVTDAGSVVLAQDANVVDAVCYSYDLVTLGAIVTGFYTCNGTPADNSAHDDTNATDVDVSIERFPGGDLGNCTDTRDNGSDFFQQMPATPQGLLSPPAP